MNKLTFLVSASLVAASALAQGPSLQDTIIAPDKAVPVINQTLSGTWLSSLRRPGPTGLQPAIPSVVTFFADGASLGSPGDGTQTATQGLWIRVGDRKFLGTAYFLGFNESRVLTSVTKLRINYQLSADGKTLTGTTEATIFDPAGKQLQVAAGATFTMIRLSPEIPADFYDFQKLP